MFNHNISMLWDPAGIVKCYNIHIHFKNLQNTSMQLSIYFIDFSYYILLEYFLYLQDYFII